MTAGRGITDGGVAGECAKVARDDLEVVVRFDAVHKRRGHNHVLSEFDLEVRAGEITVVLGPNGAGKSTMVGLMTGRLSPDRGSVLLFGAPPTRPAARARLGVMLQNNAVTEGLSVGETVALQSSYIRDPRPLEESLSLAGLTGLRARRIGTLSGGEQRRLSYALAICGRPDVLVLDEPTAALDPESRRLLWTQIRAAARSGVAIVLTTHDLAEAEALADRVLVLERGRIMTDDTPEALRARLGGTRIRCRTRIDVDLLSALSAVHDVMCKGSDLEIIAEDPVAVLRALLPLAPDLHALSVDRISLENVMERLERQARGEVAA